MGFISASAGGVCAALALLGLTACGGPGPVLRNSSKSADLTILNLQPLPQTHTYELWLKEGEQRRSLGRFNPVAGDNHVQLGFARQEIAAGMEVELSIEPASADDPAQSPQRLLSGFLSTPGSAFMTVPRALNIDPGTARIQYILETPSTEAGNDYAQGIYWCVPGSFFGLPDPVIPLPQPDVVPSLPTGWVYEGWIQDGAGQPQSTGRFPTVMVPDSDGNGPSSGPLPALPFPGQEYIDPPQTLPGRRLLLTIEPEPDYSSAPSGITLLQRDSIADEGPLTQQHMAGSEGDVGQMPSVFISFSS